MPILSTPGASLTYQREGEGPAALLLQGIGVVGEGWRPQFDGLSDRYTLLTLDNRGIGSSIVDSNRSVTVESMARDAIAVMDVEGIERFHLTGHSLGGLIAQQVALLEPARVKSLTLMCSFLRGSQAARVTPATMWTALRMWVGSPRMRRRAFLDVVMPAGYLRQHDPEQLAGRLAPLFGRDLANQPRIVMTQLLAASRYDAAARWPELHAIPTLVVSGAHDRISPPRFGRALAAAINATRLVEFPDAGHGVAIQCAAEVNALLDEHWRAAS